jgi:hypothetical protein
VANNKYQIFVSSTYEDLREVREQVIKAIFDMGHIPVGMEMFSAADDEQWIVISRTIDECDYYVVIAAHRYGSTTPEGKSFTEKEYDYAVEKNVPTIGFIIDDGAKWPSDKVDKDRKPLEALEKFKSKLKTKMVQFWKSGDDLYGKVVVSLMKLINTHPRPGWVRGGNAASAEVLNELSRLSSENASFRQLEISRSKEEQANVEQIIKDLADFKIEVSFWTREGTDWGETQNTDLRLVFFYAAPEMIIENSVSHLATSLATQLYAGKGRLRATWPIPSNAAKVWMFDLFTLGLVEPSTRKHTVHDSNQYWSLTTLGKRVYVALRERVRANEEKKRIVAKAKGN